MIAAKVALVSRDIDWTGSVEEIDRQLCRKYALSDTEIEFIETHVQAVRQ